MKPKFLFCTLLLIILLSTTVSALERIDTSNLIPVYTNTFDDASALDDFTQYYGTWGVRDGKLYLFSTPSKDQNFILFSGDDKLTELTDYVVDVDIYNVQSQGGVIARSDLQRAGGGSSGNNFYGYIGFLSFTGEKCALGYGGTTGNWGGNFIVSKNVTTPAANLHLQLAVKGDTITLNVTDLDRDRPVWSATVEDTTYTKGTFGFRLYGGSDKLFDGKTLCNLNTTAFDNLVVSVYGEDTPEAEEPAPSGMTFTNPVAPGADPFVFKDDDGTYYLYATSGDAYGYRVMSSKNLVEWTAEGYCLHYAWDGVYDDPTWTNSYKQFWAPEVIKYDGKYYMTVSFQDGLNFAVSDSPLGPFKTIGPDVLFPGIRSLDGHFFLDDDNTMYFYFVSSGAASFNGQSVASGNNIWGCVLDMEAFAADRQDVIDSASIRLLVQSDNAYDAGAKIVEGPFMIKNGDTYYLTFSSGGYKTPHYAVHYVTSKDPLSGFTRDAKNVALKSTDLYYDDIENPHLYGNAHHCFVEAPNGKDMLIVYHTHRTNRTWNETVTDLCTPRSVCVDYAWFEGEYLFAGSKENKTVPTAVAQPVFEGTTLTRKTYYTGAFKALESLPTVYVAYTDGLDTNTGAKDSPVKTIGKAAQLLKNGGTVVLMQNYTNSAHLNIPAVDGPLLITAEHGNVILYFKFISLHSTVYFDNLVFAPTTVGEISVIECNFNDVVMGEGVSCFNRPHGDYSYPYLVGGKWRYGGSDTQNVIYKDNFMAGMAELRSDQAYTITVLGGTWETVEKGSLVYKTPLANSAPNSILTYTNDALAVTADTPVVTTAAPVVTTVAPVETTEALAVTTAAPVVTTAAPVVTAATPVETTEAPVETTAAPAETTTTPAPDAPTTTAAPTMPAKDGGFNVGVIIGILVAIVAISAVVVIVIKKKKN
ncbi:MAG: family 43 glycosylhydrolase [Clostridia bacterium]|nr:family 43 glycosylhydrolase [Clostridia bacterium]